MSWSGFVTVGYPASEKLEIIRVVEQSHLPAKRTLDKLGIARRTFYRWHDRYLAGGPEALEDRPSAPSRVWNRIAPEVQDQIVEMALDYSELSPRELAVGTVRNFVRGAMEMDRKDHRYGDRQGREGRAGPASRWS